MPVYCMAYILCPYVKQGKIFHNTSSTRICTQMDLEKAFDVITTLYGIKEDRSKIIPLTLSDDIIHNHEIEKKRAIKH